MGRASSALLIVLAGLLAPPATAVTKTWVGGDPTLPRCWCKATNWNPAGVPAAGDDVIVDTSAHPPQLSFDVTCASLELRNGARLEIGPFTLHTGTLTASIGNFADAGLVMTDSNGVVVVDGLCRIGIQNDAPAADSTGHFTGGTLRVGGDFEVLLGAHPNNARGFVATGTKVVFDGAAPQTVAMFEFPGETARSRFADVEVRNAAGVTFRGPSENCRAVIGGAFLLAGGGAAAGEAIYCATELPTTTAAYGIAETHFTGRMRLTTDAVDTVLGGGVVVLDPGAAIDLNGHTLTLNANLRLDSKAAGDGLLMSDPSDVLVLEGDLDYGAVNATQLAAGGMFQAGTLHLRGDVICQPVGAAWESVMLSAGTAVRLDGSAPQAIVQAGPAGDRPRFGWPNLVIANPTRIDLRTHQALHILGVLTVPTGVDPTIAGVDGFAPFCQASGVDVDGLTFDRCWFSLGNSDPEITAPITRFDHVTWQNLDPNVQTQLLFEHPGRAASFVFRQLRFLTTPGAGKYYLWARDMDRADGQPVGVVLAEPQPADPAGHVYDGGNFYRATIQWGAPQNNQPPGAPVPLTPASGATIGVAPFGMTLKGSDPDDGAALQFQVELARAGDGQVVRTFTQPTSQEGWDKPSYGDGETASLTVDTAPADGAYTWRARAHDGFAWGPWSPAVPFAIASPMRIDSVAFSRRSTLFGTVVATIGGAHLPADSQVELLLPSAAAKYATVIPAATVAAARQAGALQATFELFDAVRVETATRIRVTAPDDRAVTADAPTLEPLGFGSSLALPGRNGRLGIEDSWSVTFDNHSDFPESPRVTLDLALLNAGTQAPQDDHHYDWEVLDATLQPVAAGTWKNGEPLPAATLPPVPAGARASFTVRLRVAPDAAARGPSRVEPVSILVVGGIIVVGALIYDGVVVGDLLRDDNAQRTVERRIHEALLFNNHLNFDEEPGYYASECRVLGGDLRDLWGSADVDTIDAKADAYARSFVGDELYPGYGEADVEAVKAAVKEGWQGKRTLQQVMHEILRRNSAVGTPEKSSVILEAFFNAALDLEPNPSRQSLPVRQVFDFSWDPNAKGGTVGVDGFIIGSEPIQYVVSFENDPEVATAAAQVVQIDDPLPAQLDLDTLTFDSLQVGARIVTLPEGTTVLDERIDLRPERNVIVAVTSTLDPATRALRISYRGLDPESGDLSPDGFLPPNATSPAGEGYVTLTVRPKDDLADGTVIRNQAVITFDPHAGVNAPITTEAHLLTIDTAAPSASLGTLPATSARPYFALPLSADDGGVGLAFCEIWVARDGGPYALFQRVEPPGRAPVASRGIFSGAYGGTYRFRVVAEDRLGNRLDPGAQPTVTVRTGPAPDVGPGLRLVSVPLDTGGADPRAVFGFSGNNWAFWCPKCVEYAVYPDARATPLKPNRGYWVRLDQPTTPVVDGVGADPTQPPLLPLAEGWNAIAVPWTQPVPWDFGAIRVVADEPGDGPDELSLAEAAAAGWIEPYAWSWQPDETAYEGRYTLVYDADVLPGVSDTLEPWRAYFVRAHRPCRLLLPPPDPDAAPARGGRGVPGTWSLRLVAGGSEVTLGVVAGRAVRFGRPPDPPTTGSGARLSVLGPGVPAAVDLRGAGGRQAWTIRVDHPASSRAQEPIELTWPSLRSLPGDLRLTLVDQQTSRRRSLRATAAYRYQPAPGESGRTFTLVAERGGAVLQVLALSCRPTRGGTLEVSYDLTAPAAVRLQLSSPTGRPVVTLEAGTAEGTGRQRLGLPLRDAQGRPLPHGLYQVLVIATDDEGRQARAVQPVMVR